VKYDELVDVLRSGAALPVATITAVVEAAGRTLGDLVAALHDPGRAPRPGDRCPGCGLGRLSIGTVRRRRDRTVRYLRCPACGETAGKMVRSEKSEPGLAGRRRGLEDES